MSILEFVNREGSPLFHLEHYIEGNYIKYNSNAGFVEDMHVRFTPHAFSHFSFECSNHELIIVDIQVNLIASTIVNRCDLTLDKERKFRDMARQKIKSRPFVQKMSKVIFQIFT
jgi:hypothetical protein